MVHFSFRVRELSKQEAKVVDVDDSYLWQKQQQLKESRVALETDVGLTESTSIWLGNYR